MEYLYGTGYRKGELEVIEFPITKVTAKRIYYDRHPSPNRSEIRVVNRQAMEAAGPDGLARKSANFSADDQRLWLNHEHAQAKVDGRNSLYQLLRATA
jgi:hypothetical protein